MFELIIFMWVIPAILSGVIAEKRGRNVLLAILLGLFFTYFAVIGYLVAGDSFENKMKKMKMMNDAMSNSSPIQPKPRRKKKTE